MSVVKLVGFACLGLSCLAVAQDPSQYPKLKAHRLEKSPTLDGKLEPGEWPDAARTSTFFDRISQKPSLDPTEGWLGYTEQGIYVAWYCHDRSPDGIIGRETIPNSEFFGEDFVIFSVNPYGSRTFEQTSSFITNVLGTKSEEIAGGRTGKREWRGDWVSKTARVSDGWIVEIMIPWKILNYEGAATKDMDFNLQRIQGKSLFRQSIANYTLNGRPEFLGRWEGVQPPPPAKAKIQFLSYVTPEVEEGRFRNRAGLDARYAFSPALNGLVSISPDFRNIEDVIAGNDFIRTERFLDETRPFFIEGGDFLDMGGRFEFGDMYYTRRIGAFDVGAKYFGQLNKRDGIGVLTTMKFDGQKTSAISFNRNFSATESAQVYATTDDSTRQNLASGFSYEKRVKNLGFDVSGAFEKDPGAKSDTAASAGLNYQRPGLYSEVRYVRVSDTFNPALAAIPWTNREGFYAYIEAQKQIQKGSLRSVRAELYKPQFLDGDGAVQEAGYDLDFDVETRNDMRFGASVSRVRFGNSVDATTGYSITSGVSNRFKRFGLFRNVGTEGDRPSVFTSLGAEYRIAKNFDMGLNQTILERDGTNRQTVATLAYQLSPSDLVTSRIVVRNDKSNFYISYRRAGFAGAEYYFIYGDPNSETTRNRVALKMVWAF